MTAAKPYIVMALSSSTAFPAEVATAEVEVI
jgi:hypothetical protein